MACELKKAVDKIDTLLAKSGYSKYNKELVEAKRLAEQLIADKKAKSDDIDDYQTDQLRDTLPKKGEVGRSVRSVGLQKVSLDKAIVEYDLEYAEAAKGLESDTNNAELLDDQEFAESQKATDTETHNKNVKKLESEIEGWLKAIDTLGGMQDLKIELTSELTSLTEMYVEFSTKESDAVDAEETRLEWSDEYTNDDGTGRKLNQQNGTKDKFDTELDKKLRGILQKLYPEIKLEYTEQQILHGEGVLNQEVVDNTVKLSLKVVEALVDWATIKPSKHGGKSAAVLETIRVKQEAGVRKRLAGKGVSKEQIDFVFEYMKQNNIGEIKTSELAEKVLQGLAQPVEINITKHSVSAIVKELKEQLENLVTHKKELQHKLENTSDTARKTAINNRIHSMTSDIATLEEDIEENTSTEIADGADNSSFYEDLTVPGGNDYKEMEISTPNVDAKLKGHADFATDKGIGWYRVDDAKQDGTLRVLEMQSDLFQKMKTNNLSEESTADSIVAADFQDPMEFMKVMQKHKGKLSFSLDKAFHQALNTDNKWVKFFIQSIIQDNQKKGYKKIRFPAGETAAKIEGHMSFKQKKAKETKIIDAELKILVNELAEVKHTHEVATENYKPDASKFWLRGYHARANETIPKLEKEIKTIRKKKARLTLEKLAPIEGFYQVRVKNTLIKTYGKNNVKTVTDEHGNQWFELTLDGKRDSNVIMLQQQGNEIKGQADIEAKTVLINSLLQSQDTLPHEYAHHYIRMFIDAPIVKAGIKKWGSEEALVQAIGEQAVEQKGEAYGWWKKFTAMLQKWFDTNFSKAGKEELKNMLTDAFLERKDLDNKQDSDIITEQDKAMDEILEQIPCDK